MEKHRSRYQQVLDELNDWLKQAVESDTLTAVEIVDKAKAYIHAAEDLSKDEMAMLENYVTRDFAAFSDKWQHRADNSMWWHTIKQEFWQVLGSMSDKYQLEWYEMQEDIAHQGVYSAGELVAIGDLVCSACGHHHPVDYLQPIVPCVECGNEIFYRKAVRP